MILVWMNNDHIIVHSYLGTVASRKHTKKYGKLPLHIWVNG
jgi:hypothetical protein